MTEPTLKQIYDLTKENNAMLKQLLERKKPKKALIQEWIEPQHVKPEVWQDFLQHRKEKRKAMTETAYKRLLRQFAAWHKSGHDLNKILLTSIANGWTGVFAVKVQSTKQTNGSSAEHVADNQLEEWARRKGAPPPKQQADYTYDRYRADLVAWEARI